MATIYTQYATSLGLGNLLLIGTPTGTTGPVTDAASSGNPNMLGDTLNDTFNFGGQVYTYVGVITLSLLGGSSLQAFVGSLAGTNFIFTPGTTPVIEIGAVQTAASPGNVNSQWNLTTDGVGCFMAGTMIATPDGGRSVEVLRPGDLVLTADGAAMPVRWLGRSSASRFGVDPLYVLPIRIRAGALGPSLPRRDLLVSPGHAVLIGGILAHAGALVNGRTIIREADVEPVFTYYHLELDTHMLLLAECAPVESFLENSAERTFQNWSERVAPPQSQEMAYPRAKSSRQLPCAARDLLDARANLIHGYMDDRAAA